MVVFGDSVAAGIGVGSDSYPNLVARALGGELHDCSDSATQIDESLQMVHEAEGADIALIAHGITEGIVRPTNAVLRWMPRRWRRPGWMDPRPYYSHRLWKRITQRAESAMRWRIKVLAIRHATSERWCKPDRYEQTLQRMVEELQERGVRRVVIVGNSAVDERYFPGSEDSLQDYLAAGQRVAERTGGEFCDVSDVCQRWNHFFADHFHPNPTGHQRIADCIIKMITHPGHAENTRTSNP
jgi:GDSL-like Lipase/Acylhydrolase family